MFLMNKIRRIIVLPAHEKGIVARALFWLWFFRLRNLILPYRLTKKWLSEEVGTYPTPGLQNVAIIKGVTRSVRTCSRYVPGATCLTQALAARAMLRHYGQEANIRLGVIKSEVSIDAHAWVEIDGRIVLGQSTNSPHYAVLRPPSWL